MSEFLVKSLILATASIGGIVAVCGKTTDPEKSGWRRVTPAGWLAICCLIFGFAFGVVAHRRELSDAEKKYRGAENARLELAKQLDATLKVAKRSEAKSAWLGIADGILEQGEGRLKAQISFRDPAPTLLQLNRALLETINRLIIHGVSIQPSDVLRYVSAFQSLLSRSAKETALATTIELFAAELRIAISQNVAPQIGSGELPPIRMLFCEVCGRRAAFRREVQVARSGNDRRKKSHQWFGETAPNTFAIGREDAPQRNYYCPVHKENHHAAIDLRATHGDWKD